MSVGRTLLFLVLALPGACRAGGEWSLRDAAAAPLTPSAPAAGDGDRAWMLEDTIDPEDQPISPGRAVLYSLLLPGLGDYKLGHKGRAATFFAIEGAIWVSYAAFEVQGSQREDEYESLAVRFAGVSHTGHSDEYYAQLRDYDNSEEYEADVKRSGAGVASSEELEAYFIENRVEDYEPWQWDSLDRRFQYAEMRSSSKTSYRRADYMFAAAAANRVVSSIFAYAAARSARSQAEVGYRVHFAPADGGVDVAVSFTRSF